VRERWDEFADRDASALVVSFAAAERLEDYRDHLALPFAVAADPDRRAYRAYGLTRGSLWQIWGPRVLWRYATLLARGRRPQRPARGDDLSQLGGDFVIAGDGRLSYAHLSHSPADRPPVEDLLRALAVAD
jgi:hypothetical protein